MCIATEVAAPAPGRSSGLGRRPRCPPAQAPPPSAPSLQDSPGDRIQLERILFDTCSDCSRSKVEAMSSIPQGTLAVRAVSANQKKVPMDAGVSEFVFEHPPLKYSSKLMNSIWGLYNRYSVHNFKKNMNVDAALCGMQQQRFLAAASL